MVSLKGVAFALGGIGILLFIGGVGMAFLATPPCASKTGTCPDWDTERLTANVMFLCIGAVILECTAVVFLFLHLRDARREALRGPVLTAPPSQRR